MKTKVLRVFSIVEFLGIMGFVIVLIYYDLKDSKIVSLPEFTTDPLSVANTMVILLLIFIVGFIVSNPKQDQLDKDRMEEWRAGRVKEMIAWYEAHPLVA